MTCSITSEQIKRLAWIRSRLWFPHILLFFDRDEAGRDAAGLARERLARHNVAVTVFDWDQRLSCNGQAGELIAESIQDPGDMSVEQLRSLRRQGIL